MFKVWQATIIHAFNTMNFAQVSSNDANDTLVLILIYMADYHPYHFGLKKRYLTSLKFRLVVVVAWIILCVSRMKLNVNVSWKKKT
jgi:fatty-acid desaturase